MTPCCKPRAPPSLAHPRPPGSPLPANAVRRRQHGSRPRTRWLSAVRGYERTAGARRSYQPGVQRCHPCPRVSATATYHASYAVRFARRSHTRCANGAYGKNARRRASISECANEALSSEISPARAASGGYWQPRRASGGARRDPRPPSRPPPMSRFCHRPRVRRPPRTRRRPASPALCVAMTDDSRPGKSAVRARLPLPNPRKHNLRVRPTG